MRLTEGTQASNQIFALGIIAIQFKRNLMPAPSSQGGNIDNPKVIEGLNPFPSGPVKMIADIYQSSSQGIEGVLKDSGRGRKGAAGPLQYFSGTPLAADSKCCPGMNIARKDDYLPLRTFTLPIK